MKIQIGNKNNNDKDLIRYFYLEILRFKINCFNDCGEWFLYFIVTNKRRDNCRGIRFSSAGFKKF